MTASIFIRTWRGDLGWLRYCLAFLAKNWVGHERIFIIANSDCREECQQWKSRAEFIYVDAWPDTHEFKCYCALLSEGLSDADLILNLDSDMMLFKKSGLDDFLYDSRPVVNYRAHAEMGDYLGIRLYNPSLLRWFGVLPARSYMILPPFVFWRSTIRAMRELIEKKSGKSLRDTLYSERPFDWRLYPQHPKQFPDWEALGFYAELYEPSRYHFRNPTCTCTHYNEPAYDPGNEPIKPYHSWTQWTPETRAELDRLLAQ